MSPVGFEDQPGESICERFRLRKLLEGVGQPQHGLIGLDEIYHESVKRIDIEERFLDTMYASAKPHLERYGITDPSLYCACFLEADLILGLRIDIFGSRRRTDVGCLRGIFRGALRRRLRPALHPVHQRDWPRTGTKGVRSRRADGDVPYLGPVRGRYNRRMGHVPREFRASVATRRTVDREIRRVDRDRVPKYRPPTRRRYNGSWPTWDTSSS